VFDRPKLFHIIHIKVRDAPAFDFSSGPKFLKCLDRFRKWRTPFSPMQQVKIDGVDAETLETALACSW
jgi:hypothetical protein